MATYITSYNKTVNKRYFFTKRNRIVFLGTSQCGGSGMFIPDPGSDFFPSRIRTVSIPDPGSSSKNLSILTPKKAKEMVSKLQKIWSGLFIPDPGSGCWLSPIPDPGYRGQKGTQSRIPDPDPQHWHVVHCSQFLFLISDTHLRIKLMARCK